MMSLRIQSNLTLVRKMMHKSPLMTLTWTQVRVQWPMYLSLLPPMMTFSLSRKKVEIIKKHLRNKGQMFDSIMMMTRTTRMALML